MEFSCKILLYLVCFLSEIALSFKVAPVKKNALRYKPSSIGQTADVLEGYWKRKYPFELPLKFEVGFSNHKLITPKHRSSKYCDEAPKPPVPAHQHGLIATVLAAYNNHWPLILSPDDFWLMKTLGVSEFLGSNKEMAEKYRDSFVSHEGQKMLTVFGNKYGIVPKDPEANGIGWPLAMMEMAEKIKNETKTNIANIMTTPFSTTGNIEQTAFNTVLMETMKNYFIYRVLLACGIPEIILEGTTEDYKSILYRLNELIKIFPDFSWYLKRVRKHMIKVYKSKIGKVNRDWWRTMIGHIPEMSGRLAQLSGWLADFIAFVNGKPYGRDTWDTLEFEHINNPAVTWTDFILEDRLYTMKIYDMKLVSGFVGVAIDKKKKAVRPAIGWMTYYWKERPIILTLPEFIEWISRSPK